MGAIMRDTFKGYYIIMGIGPYGLWVDNGFGELVPIWNESIVQLVNFITEGM